jgi:hypothetical protein
MLRRANTVAIARESFFMDNPHPQLNRRSSTTSPRFTS